MYTPARVLYAGAVSPVTALAAVVVALPSPGGGGIAGRVLDAATDRPLAGAVVALDDLGRATVTDDDGWYWLLDVPPGPQHLSVGLLGYRSRSIHVLVPGGGTLRVDLSLETEPIEVQAVVVRGRIALPGLGRDGPELVPRRRAGTAGIRNDPFAAEPDPLDALVGGPLGKSPEAAGGLHVRGGATDQVGYALDGLPVFSPYHAGARASAWSPAALAEIDLTESPSPPTDALTGTVRATTIDPGDRLRSTGEITTSRIEFGLDGPLAGPVGFLLSLRYGFPGLAFHPSEASYLRGEDHDVLAKAQAEVAGGRLRLLAFDNRNALRFAAVSTDAGGDAVDPLARNALEWRSGTVGVAWDASPGAAVRGSARAWRSGAETAVGWIGSDPALRDVESERSQIGASASVAWGEPDRSTEIGATVARDRIDYAVGGGGDDADAYRLRDAEPFLEAHAGIVRRPADRVEVRLDLVGTVDESGVHGSPYVETRWIPSDRIAFYARYAGTSQRAQSFRNAESILGGVFPPELPARGTGRVRAHAGTVGVVAIPRDGVRVSAEAYGRSVKGWALVAPAEGRPFATGTPVTGTGAVRGAYVEATAGGARYGAIGSLTVERVEVEAADLEYVPGYATRRRARLGGIVHLGPTFSVRAAWVGEFGRRGTDTVGIVEWESCNLLDGGCEVAGTPEALGALGAVRLPAYHRLDLSLRKHWHVRVAGRDARVEVFGSGTNLLGRANRLTHVVDPSTGERRAIEMRPAAPIAFGVAWEL